MSDAKTASVNGFQDDATRFYHNKDDRLYRKRVGAVSEDLITFRQSLVAVLDELESEIRGIDREDDLAAEVIRKDVAYLKKLQEIERYNAAARNYNGAMDTESDFLCPLKGVCGDFFDKDIDGFPVLVEDIEKGFSITQAEQVLRALGIDFLHSSDTDNHWVKPRSHQRLHKDGKSLEELKKARVKRQLRIAIGLAPNPIRVAAVHVSPIDII